MTTAAFVRVGLLAAAFAVAAASPGRAADAGPDVRTALAPKAREAFDSLMTAKRFESSRVGEGGTLSHYAAAVRTLIREQEAPAAFQALYERGSPVTRLYALAAFWYLRPGEFGTLVRDVRQRDGNATIETQRGCIILDDKVGDLLERRSRDVVRLQPGTGLYAFMCAMRKRKSFTDDVIGGAVPIDIVEGGGIQDAKCAHPPPLPDYLKPRR
jgi:hypothetical protein